MEMKTVKQINGIDAEDGEQAGPKDKRSSPGAELCDQAQKLKLHEQTRQLDQQVQQLPERIHQKIGNVEVRVNQKEMENKTNSIQEGMENCKRYGKILPADVMCWSDMALKLNAKETVLKK